MATQSNALLPMHMRDHPHTARVATMARIALMRDTYGFSHAGCCEDMGKYEGCYEATVYLHQLGLEGDYGEGLVSYPDGASVCAYKVTREERAMLAGPWDQAGSIHLTHDNVLYTVWESEDGTVTGSHCTEADFAECLAGEADLED